MATYRPIKKIAIPLVALILGFGIAFLFMPTKMDAVWKEWTNHTKHWETSSYTMESAYFRNGLPASVATGIWSNHESRYTLEANVSDDSVFSFDINIEDDKFYMKSGDEWRQGSMDDRFIAEISPLDQPFEWIRDVLVEAEKVEKKKEAEKVTYVATFDDFNEFDFRGYSLEQQKETTLTLTIEEGTYYSMRFHALPLRPDYIGLFDEYPEELEYELTFTRTEEELPPLPPEAYKSKGLDE